MGCLDVSVGKAHELRVSVGITTSNSKYGSIVNLLVDALNGCGYNPGGLHLVIVFGQVLCSDLAIGDKEMRNDGVSSDKGKPMGAVFEQNDELFVCSS